MQDMPTHHRSYSLQSPRRVTTEACFERPVHFRHQAGQVKDHRTDKRSVALGTIAQELGTIVLDTTEREPDTPEPGRPDHTAMAGTLAECSVAEADHKARPQPAWEHQHPVGRHQEGTFASAPSVAGRGYHEQQ